MQVLVHCDAWQVCSFALALMGAGLAWLLRAYDLVHAPQGVLEAWPDDNRRARSRPDAMRFVVRGRVRSQDKSHAVQCTTPTLHTPAATHY